MRTLAFLFFVFWEQGNMASMEGMKVVAVTKDYTFLWLFLNFPEFWRVLTEEWGIIEDM